MSAEYISVTETAKLVRKALKQEFPITKFSVRARKYANGASIDVSWTDGPRGARVDSVVDPYRGADFDGSIDMKHYGSSWLMPDGTASTGHWRGSEGSMGYQPERIGDPVGPSARLVHFGADFIQLQRELSSEMKQTLRDEIREFVGVIPEGEEWRVELPVSTFRDYTDDGDETLRLAWDRHGRGNTLASLIHQLGCQRDYEEVTA
jgi:hypothetical protein